MCVCVSVLSVVHFSDRSFCFTRLVGKVGMVDGGKGKEISAHAAQGSQATGSRSHGNAHQKTLVTKKLD